VPKTLPLGVVVKVLKNLLAENIPIRDIRTIAETLAAVGAKSQDPGELTATVRQALGRMTVSEISGIGDELDVITINPSLEQLLQQAVQNANQNGVGLEPGLTENLQQAIGQVVSQQEAQGRTPVLLVAQALRPLLAGFARQIAPALKVLSYNEVPDDRRVKIVATIGGEAALTA